MEANAVVALEGVDGARDDFDRFVSARRPAMVRMVWAMTGDQGLAEDVTQIALERLWRRWARIPVVDAERWAYAQRVVVSQVVTWRRRRWTTHEVPTDPLPDQVGASPTADWVRPWLAELPPRQRAAIVLRYLADLSVDETAAVLACSSGTVKSQCSKALATLRTALGRETSDE